MSTTLSAAKLAEVKVALAESPSAMTLQLARRLGVPEAEVIRAMPDGRSVELDVERWEELFAAFADLGKVHVIVSNASVTCETVGEFGGFSVFDEFFNVQSKTLDMHIRFEQLGSAFAVEKPGHLGGHKTLSIQFFDREGASALKVFVNFSGKPTAQQEQQFTELRERFRTHS
jgi:putative heme iron utilization protein